MIRRYDKRNYHSVGMVIDSEDDEEDLIFCEQCRKNGTTSKLKQRLYLDDKGKRLVNPPPDADEWLQCWKCGYIIAVREAKRKGRISGILGIEPIDNPYDFNKGVILGNDSKHRYQRLKQRKNKHPDSEVQRMIDDGYELISYQNYTPGE
jgi:hypothetical protein